MTTTLQFGRGDLPQRGTTTNHLTQGLDLELDDETRELEAAQERLDAENAASAQAQLDIVIPRMVAPDRITVALASGAKFYVEPFPGLYAPGEMPADFDAAKPFKDAGAYGVAVNSVISSANRAFAKVEQISANAELSSLGRNKAMVPVLADAANSVAAAWTIVLGLQRDTLAAEAKFYEVPRVGVSEGGTATEDKEIREWWRSLSEAQAGIELQTLATDPAGYRALLALMRSPIPMKSAMFQAVGEVWTEGRRSIDPVGALKIDQQKAAAEWAFGALQMAALTITNALDMTTYTAMRMVLSEPDDSLYEGAGAFGTATEVARVKLVLEGERMALRN